MRFLLVCIGIAVLHGADPDSLGQAAFQAGNYRDAKKHFEHALRSAVGDIVPELSNLGQACQALGEFARAEQLYRQALDHMPERATLWQLLGAVLFQQHKYASAEHALQRAIALPDPRTAAIARNDLAMLLEARGRGPAALALLKQAIAAAPAGQSRARMLANLGNLHLKMDDRAAAVQAFRTSLQEMEIAVGPAHPDVGQILLDYAQALQKSGNKSEAKRAALRAETIFSAFSAQTNINGATADYRDLR